MTATVLPTKEEWDGWMAQMKKDAGGTLLNLGQMFKPSKKLKKLDSAIKTFLSLHH